MHEILEDVLRHGIYWLDYWLLFNLAGLVLIRLWLTTDSPVVAENAFNGWMRSWFVYSLSYSANSMIVLLLDIVELTGEPLSATTGSSLPMLMDSYFGVTWAVRSAIVVGLMALTVWFMYLAPGSGAAVAGLCLLMLSFTYSATSHAANQGNLTPLQLAHWLHLVAAMVWAGAILGAYQHLELTVKEAAGVTQLGGCLDKLSQLAALAFVPVLAGGLYTAWSLMAGRLDLLSEPYSQRLAVKLLLVAGMLVVAVRLRVNYIPAMKNGELEAPGAIEKVQKVLSVDRALVAMVLLLASGLTHQIPPVDLLASPVME